MSQVVWMNMGKCAWNLYDISKQVFEICHWNVWHRLDLFYVLAPNEFVDVLWGNYFVICSTRSPVTLVFFLKQGVRGSWLVVICDTGILVILYEVGNYHVLTCDYLEQAVAIGEVLARHLSGNGLPIVNQTLKLSFIDQRKLVGL
jgi:hypothetical protein